MLAFQMIGHLEPRMAKALNGTGPPSRGKKTEGDITV